MDYPLNPNEVIDDFEPVMPVEPELEYKPHPTKTYTSRITVQPPASFRPVPVNQSEPVPRPEPPSVPPKPFKDVGVFENVDTHAVEVEIT